MTQPVKTNGEAGLSPLPQASLQCKQIHLAGNCGEDWILEGAEVSYFPSQFIASCSAPCKLSHLKAFRELDQAVPILASLYITVSILFVLLGLLACVIITPAPSLSAFSQQCFINLFRSPWLEGSVLFPALIFMVHKILTSLTRKSYGH